MLFIIFFVFNYQQMQQQMTNLKYKLEKLRQKTKQKMISSVKYLIKNETYFEQIEKTIKDYQGHHSLQISIDPPNQKVSKAIKQSCQQIKGVYNAETVQDIDIKNLQKQIETLEFYGKICNLDLIEKRILQAIIWPKQHSLTWDDIYNLTNHIIKWSIYLKQFLEYLPGNNKVVSPLELQEVYGHLKKPIDSIKLWIYLNKKNAKQQKYKEVVLIIGRTGVGKTTFIQSMLGYRHQGKYDEQDDVWTLQTTKPLQQIHKSLVAKTSAESVTSDINVLNLECGEEDRSLFLVDCPGLNDTRGREVQLANNYLREVFLKGCQKIVVIQMVRINDLLADRVNNARQYAQYLKKQYIFNDQQELASHLMLLYNYSDSDQANQLKSLIEQQLLYENDPQLTIAYKFMKNQVSQPHYHIRKKSLGGRTNDQYDFQQMESNQILKALKTKIYVETNMFIKNLTRSEEHNHLLQTIKLDRQKMEYYLNLKKIKEAKHQHMILRQLFKCFRDPPLLITYNRTFIDMLKGFYFEAVSNLQIEDKNQYFTQEQYLQIKKFNCLIKDIRLSCHEFSDLKQKNEEYERAVKVFLQTLSDSLINKDKLDENEISYLKKYSSELQNDTYKHFIQNCIHMLSERTCQIERAIDLLTIGIDFKGQLDQIQRLIKNLSEDEVIVYNLNDNSLPNRFSIQCFQQLGLKLQILAKTMAQYFLTYTSQIVQQVIKNFQEYYFNIFEQRSMQVFQSVTIFRKVIPHHNNILEFINCHELEQAIKDFFQKITVLYQQFSKFIQKLQGNQYDLAKAKTIAVNFKRDMNQIFNFDLLKDLYPPQLTRIKEDISQTCRAKYNQLNVLKTMILNLIKNKGIDVDLQQVKIKSDQAVNLIKCSDFYRWYLQINSNDDFQVQLECSLKQKYGLLYQQQQSLKNVSRLLNLQIQLSKIVKIIAKVNVNNQILAKVQQLLAILISKITNVKVYSVEKLKRYTDEFKVLSQQINPEDIVNTIKYISEIIKQDQRYHNCKEIQFQKSELASQYTAFWNFFEQNLNEIKFTSIFDRDTFNQVQSTKQMGFFCKIIEIFAKLKSVQLVSSNKNYDLKLNIQFIQKNIKAVNQKFIVLNAQFQEEKKRYNKSRNSSQVLKKMMKDLSVYEGISYYMKKYFENIAHAQGSIGQTICQIRQKIRESIQNQSNSQQTQIQLLFKNFLTTEFSELRFSNLWNMAKQTQKREFFVNQFENYIELLIEKNIKQRRFNRITEQNAQQLKNVSKNAKEIDHISKKTMEKLNNQILQQTTKTESRLKELLDQIKNLTKYYQFEQAHNLCNKAYKSIDLLDGYPICQELKKQKHLIVDKEKKIQKVFVQKTGEQSLTPHKIAKLQEELQIHIYLISKKPHFANKIRLNFKKQVELLVKRFERQYISVQEFVQITKIYQKFCEYSKHAFDGLRISQFFTIKQTLQKHLQMKLSHFLNIFLRQLTTQSNHSQTQEFLMIEKNLEILKLSQFYPQIPEYKRIKDFIKKRHEESIRQMINCQDAKQQNRMAQRIKTSIQKINNQQLPFIRDDTREITESFQKHYQSAVLNNIHQMINDFEKKQIENCKLINIKEFLEAKKEQYKDVYYQLGDHLRNYSSKCTRYLLAQQYLQCLPQEYMNLGSRIQREFRICYNYQKLKQCIQNLYQPAPKEQKTRTQLFIQQIKKGLQRVQRLNFEGKYLLYINRSSFINRQAQKKYVLSFKKDFLLLKVIYKKISQFSPLYNHFKKTDMLTKFIDSLSSKIKSQTEKMTKQLEAIIFSDDTKQTKQKPVCLVPYFQIKTNLINLFIQNFNQLKNKQSSHYKEGSNDQKQRINKKLAESQQLQQIYLMKKLGIFKPQLMLEKQSEIKSHLKKEQVVEALKKSYNKQKRELRKFILNKIISQNSSFEYHVANITRFINFQKNRMEDIEIQFFKHYTQSLSELVKKSPTLEMFSLKKYYEQKCGTYQETSIILSIISYIFPETLFYQNYPFITYFSTFSEIKNINNTFNLQYLQKTLMKISNSQKQTLKMFVSLYYMLNNYDVYVICDSNSMLILNKQRTSIFKSKNMESQQKFQVFNDFSTFLSKRKQILAHKQYQKQQRKQIIVVQAQRILNLLLDNHTTNKQGLNVDILEHLQYFQLYTILCITPQSVIHEPIKTIYPEIRICQKSTTKKQDYQFKTELTKDIDYSSIAKYLQAFKTKRNSNVIVCFQNSDQLQLFLERNSHLLTQYYQSFVIIDDKQEQTYVRELKFQSMDIFTNILLITKEMFLRLKKSKHLSINQKEIQFILTYCPDFSMNLQEIRSVLNSISSKSTFKIALNIQSEKKINIKKDQNEEVLTLKEYLLFKQKKTFNEIFKHIKDFSKTKAKKAQNSYI